MLALLQADFPDKILPDVEYLKMGFDECVLKSKYCKKEGIHLPKGLKKNSERENNVFIMLMKA